MMRTNATCSASNRRQTFSDKLVDTVEHLECTLRFSSGVDRNQRVNMGLIYIRLPETRLTCMFVSTAPKWAKKSAILKGDTKHVTYN